MARFLHWSRARLADLCSFETALIMLIYFPDIKSAANAGSMSTGLLVAFSAVCFAGAVGLLVRGKLRMRKDAGVLLWLWLAFVVWVVLSLLWTPSVFAAQRAVTMLLTMSTCTLAGAALIVSTDPQRARRYYFGVVVMGLWLAWASYLTYRTVLNGDGTAGNIKALGLNYLILGRAIGAGTLVCAYYVLYRRWPWYWRALTGAAALAMLGALTLLGGRTPLVGTVMCLAILAAGVVRWSRSPRGLLVQVTLVLVVLSGLVLAASRVSGDSLNALTSVQRIQFLFTRGFEANDRYQRYTQTWINIDHNPIVGQGVASWPVLMGYGDRHDYAHDVLLEIWFDLGIPGLMLMLGMWWWCLHRYWPPARWLKLPFAPLALVLFINAMLGALSSGDYSEQWWLYANMGMLLVVPLANSAHGAGVKVER